VNDVQAFLNFLAPVRPLKPQLPIRSLVMPLTATDLKGSLPLLIKGKVRDLYEVNDRTLLFVATDRISAYDVVLKNVTGSL
jgi:hypothetical protein